VKRTAIFHIDGIDVCLPIKKECHALKMTVTRGSMKRDVAILIDEVDVGVLVKKRDEILHRAFRCSIKEPEPETVVAW